MIERFDYDRNVFTKENGVYLPKLKWEARYASTIERIVKSIPHRIDGVIAYFGRVPEEYVTRFRTHNPLHFKEVIKLDESRYHLLGFPAIISQFAPSGEPLDVKYIKINNTLSTRTSSIDWALTRKVILEGSKSDSYYTVEDNLLDKAVIQPLKEEI